MKSVFILLQKNGWRQNFEVKTTSSTLNLSYFKSGIRVLSFKIDRLKAIQNSKKLWQVHFFRE